MAATIQAMVGASSFRDLQRVTTHSYKSNFLCPGLSINPSLCRVTLPSSFVSQSCRITCQASKSSGKVDPWEQPDTFTQYSGYIAEAALEEADQLNEYNADKFAAIFKRRPFLLARRLVQIAGTLGWWAAVRYGDTVFGKKDQNFKVCWRAEGTLYLSRCCKKLSNFVTYRTVRSSIFNLNSRTRMCIFGSILAHFSRVQ